MSEPKLQYGAHDLQTPPDPMQAAPPAHRNPRVHRFDLRMPDQGLPYICLMEAFFEYSAPWHTHPTTQVLISLEEGLTIHTEDGRDWILRAGEGMVIPAGVLHQPGPGEKGRRMLTLNLLISAEPANPLERWLTRSHACWRWVCDRPMLDASVAQLSALSRQTASIHPAHLMQAVWGLFVPAHAEAELQNADAPIADDPDAVDKRVLYLESLMRNRLEQPYDAEVLAQSAQISVSQMNRLFKEHRGITPMRYLQAVRIEQARQYMVNSTLSAKQVAERCGFTSQVHFTELFKKTYGQAPGAYRAALAKRASPPPPGA